MDLVLDLAGNFDVGFTDEDVHLRSNAEFWQVDAGFDGRGYARDELPGVVGFPIVEIDGVRVNFGSDAMTETMDKPLAVTVFRD